MSGRLGRGCLLGGGLQGVAVRSDSLLNVCQRSCVWVEVCGVRVQRYPCESRYGVSVLLDMRRQKNLGAMRVGLEFTSGCRRELCVV